MLLNFTAYRTCNISAHDVHTCDLLEILKLVHSNGDYLAPAALRAVFWVDLYAAIVVGSKRQMSRLDLLQRVSSQR